MSKPVVEVVFFKLKAGQGLAAFERASEKIQKFLSGQPGYIRRELLHSSESGQFVDLVHWSTREDAMNAAQQIMKSTDAGEFMSSLSQEGLQMFHLDIFSTHPK